MQGILKNKMLTKAGAFHLTRCHSSFFFHVCDSCQVSWKSKKKRFWKAIPEITPLDKSESATTLEALLRSAKDL
jgi:hypothetical protein